MMEIKRKTEYDDGKLSQDNLVITIKFGEGKFPLCRFLIIPSNLVIELSDGLNEYIENNKNKL